jgi:uncharacterized protein YggE
MRRLILLVLVVGALLLSACGNGGGTLVSSAGADSGINVSGQGRVTGKPDTLAVSLGVSVLRPSANGATADAAALATAIIAALEANGVVKDDIQTANYTIYPEYDWSREQQRLLGYRVTNEVRVKIRNVDNAGTIIDAATNAGGDATVVSNLSFSIEDNAELLQIARDAAWADAEGKARQLAQLAGLELGAAISITESITYEIPPIYYGRDMPASEDGSTPIEAGTQDVIVNIQVAFRIN